jgi:hypothetical protein
MGIKCTSPNHGGEIFACFMLNHCRDDRHRSRTEEESRDASSGALVKSQSIQVDCRAG